VRGPRGGQLDRRDAVVHEAADGAEGALRLHDGRSERAGERVGGAARMVERIGHLDERVGEIDVRHRERIGGGGAGNVTQAVYAYSSNSGGSYDTIGTLSITYDTAGYVTGTTWS